MQGKATALGVVDDRNDGRSVTKVCKQSQTQSCRHQEEGQGRKPPNTVTAPGDKCLPFERSTAGNEAGHEEFGEKLAEEAKLEQIMDRYA